MKLDNASMTLSVDKWICGENLSFTLSSVVDKYSHSKVNVHYVKAVQP